MRPHYTFPPSGPGQGGSRPHLGQARLREQKELTELLIAVAKSGRLGSMGALTFISESTVCCCDRGKSDWDVVVRLTVSRQDDCIYSVARLSVLLRSSISNPKTGQCLSAYPYCTAPQDLLGADICRCTLHARSDGLSQGWSATRFVECISSHLDGLVVVDPLAVPWILISGTSLKTKGRDHRSGKGIQRGLARG